MHQTLKINTVALLIYQNEYADFKNPLISNLPIFHSIYIQYTLPKNAIWYMPFPRFEKPTQFYVMHLFYQMVDN